MLQCIESLRLQAQWRRRFDQTLIELQRYSDRELCELGISPVDVRRIAREVAFAPSRANPEEEESGFPSGEICDSSWRLE